MDALPTAPQPSVPLRAITRSGSTSAFADSALPCLVAKKDTSYGIPDATTAALIPAFAGLANAAPVACRTLCHDTSHPSYSTADYLEVRLTNPVQLTPIVPTIRRWVNKVTLARRYFGFECENAAEICIVFLIGMKIKRLDTAPDTRQ